MPRPATRGVDKVNVLKLIASFLFYLEPEVSSVRKKRYVEVAFPSLKLQYCRFPASDF